jgi:hypothetical protein
MGTGGSRYGAGRPGWRRKCEHLPRLHVRHFHGKGYLKQGRHAWSWNRGDEPAGSVSVYLDPNTVTVTYQWTPSGGKPIPRSTVFRLQETQCHFGGVRYWFGCPWCGRRCAIIYGVSGDGYFGCRRCLKLGYSSESEGAMDRLWRQQLKLEATLGDNYQKPKWMRMKTYERIWAKIGEIEERKDAVCRAGIMRIMRRGGLTMADL